MTAASDGRSHASATWVGWSVVAVASASALIATIPAAPHVEDVPAAATREPLSRTVLTCPPGAGDAVVRVVTTGDVDGGEVALSQGGEVVRGRTGDRGGSTTVPVAAGPVEVRATGAAARGLLAVRTEEGDGTVAAAGCLAAQQQWWFTGAGGGVDHGSVLFLSNPDEGPAVVDVHLSGATGSVDVAGTRGLAVAPGRTLRVPLTRFAPGSDELTVEAVAVRGRIVAHVLDTVRTSRGEARGWLPAAPPPAEQLLLPGVPAGAGRVELLVGNAGSEQALVDLELLTEGGAFVPLGSEQLSVDPGTVEKVDLTGALDGRAAAVRLGALVPVTAAVRVTDGADVAHAPVAVPLAGPSGVVMVGNRSAIQVAAADEAAALRLDAYAADGRRVLRRAVTVPPSALVEVPVPDRATHAVLLPRAGDGYAAAVHTGAGVASRPVTPLRTSVLRPSVVPYVGQSDW